MHFSFEYPIFLTLLPLVVCFFYCKKNKTIFYIPKLEYIHQSTKRINLYTILKIITFLLLVFALSSPFLYKSISPDKRDGRAIILTLDTSGSMRESGFGGSKKSKFDIVLDLASNFIDKRVSDNIGIVAFGTFAFSASPVTYDHQALKEILNMLEVEIAGKNTAIADALDESIRNLSHSKAKEKIIILLTDGMNNRGKISINDAINELKNTHIKVYTIGLGSSKTYDKKLLDHIASSSNGKSFEAQNIKDLQNVYEEIDRLNPSKIRSEQYLNKKELFIYPLFLATLFSFYLLYREEIL